MGGRALVAALVVGALLAGCGSPAPSDVPATRAPGESSAPAPSGAAAPSVPGSPGGPSATVIPSGPMALDDLGRGLDTLAAYDARLELTFSGAQGGAPSAWTRSWALTAARGAGTRLLTYEEKGLAGGAPALPFLQGTANGVAYFRDTPSSPCSGSFAAAGPPDLVEPADLLPRVRTWSAGAAEDLDGIATERHAFGASGVTDVATATATGTVWIASQGGYVRRLDLELTGGTDLFDADTTGSLTWRYDVQPRDPATLDAVPGDCPAPLPDLALPGGAANVISFPGYVAYETSRTADQLATFYRPKMAALGYKPTGDSNKGTLHAALAFAKGDRSIEIEVSVGKPSVVHLTWRAPAGAAAPSPAPSAAP